MTETIFSADSVHWEPRVRVEKFSPGQAAYASRLITEAGRRGRPYLVAGQPVRRLHGDLLRRLCGEPEDGVATDRGNIMVNTGLTNLISLLVGVSGAAVNKLGAGGGVSGSAVVGVGSTATAATAADTHLGADGTTPNGTVGCWYQSMDASYPNLTTPAVINGQSTFAPGNANMAWNEWCWAAGAGLPTAGTTLSGIYATSGSVAMMNHKVPVSGLGTKAAGAAWVFATTITFS